ncbi:hypothetical protein F5J12DRAFT_785078 [Pisolithus orientalis]|uniref:uncharacterized protein n=1 Tax=Pisolithus orientalis TaxID=936130 RepID=UPI002225212C|nr:uncharacterized protein F5J12DRAFT_785078 [Pisolithus orientalis]KAI5997863.1 hypothetical protein F5J12DRAFT_785078 [Pisolithus orientalis]
MDATDHIKWGVFVLQAWRLMVRFLTIDSKLMWASMGTKILVSLVAWSLIVWKAMFWGSLGARKALSQETLSPSSLILWIELYEILTVGWAMSSGACSWAMWELICGTGGCSMWKEFSMGPASALGGIMEDIASFADA